MMRFVIAFVLLMLGTSYLKPDTVAWTQYGGTARNFRSGKPNTAQFEMRKQWRRALGVGTSGIVTDGDKIYTLYADTHSKNGNQSEEVIVALDKRNGKTLWQYRYPMKRLEEQESYDEPRVRPQSTPAWNNGKLCTLGYSGLLKCFDAANGKLLWEYDLVKTFGATPVQFGFSSSPLVYGEWFVVGVGGKQASVITFRAKDGAIVWKSEAAEPSYASPIVLNVGGDTQIVQVNRDNILGISAKDGSTRWRYPMPKPGLTNVPTPIALSDGNLLVSGQGLAATRLLQIVEQAGRYTVTERWKNTKAIFFYCNWVVDNTAVYGCVGDFIGALDLSDGKILWDERGFANANLLHLGGETAILRGDGQIAFCRLVPEKFAPRAGKAVLSGRCWTPPTATGDTLLVRDDKEIAAVRLIPAAKSE